MYTILIMTFILGFCSFIIITEAKRMYDHWTSKKSIPINKKIDLLEDEINQLKTKILDHQDSINQLFLSRGHKK